MHALAHTHACTCACTNTHAQTTTPYCHLQKKKRKSTNCLCPNIACSFVVIFMLRTECFFSVFFFFFGGGGGVALFCFFGGLGGGGEQGMKEKNLTETGVRNSKKIQATNQTLLYYIKISSQWKTVIANAYSVGLNWITHHKNDLPSCSGDNKQSKRQVTVWCFETVCQGCINK